jgi:anti-anti-sigma factor
MNVRIDGQVCYLSGELDAGSAGAFRAAVTSNVDPKEEVVIDLTELRFLDSTGVKVTIYLAQRFCERGIVLRNPWPNVGRLLRIVDIEAVQGIRVERRS